MNQKRTKNGIKIKYRSLKTLLIFSLVLGFTYGCKQKQTVPRNPRTVMNSSYKSQILKGIEILRTYLITTNTPGLSVSVSIDGKTIWSQGFGYASKELKAPAGPETKYRIGTTSQTITAMGAIMLKNQNKLDFSKSYYAYMPDFPKKAKDFKVGQLLSHTAGFKPIRSRNMIREKDVHRIRDYVNKFKDDKQAYSPGDYFAISDYNYVLLGQLEAKLSNASFGHYISKSVLDTLHMDDTCPFDPYIIIPGKSAPYHLNYIARLSVPPFIDLRASLPANGFLSTADDINKLGQCILKPGVFNQDDLNLMLNKSKLNDGHDLNYGVGWWNVKDQNNRPFYASLGTVVGGSSSMVVYPKAKLVVSICANLEDENGQLPALKVANVFYPVKSN